MSFCGPRPTVSGAESSIRPSPGSSVGLRTTTRRPTSRGPESRTTAISCACEGARMKLSCGIRRSLLAVRTMRQMNRYSSTTKAILRTSRSSSTAIEAKGMSASGLALEDELGRPDGDRVTGAQLRALQPSAVDLGSLRRAQVDHPVCGSLLSHLRMAARDIRVGDLDVAVLRAADDDAPLLDLMPPAIPGERRDLPLQSKLLRRDRLSVRLLRLVDHGRAGSDLGSRRFVRRGLRPTLRHPGRDSEFAHLQVLVGLHQHPRWGQQHVLLPAGVLREVVLELPEQRLFVVRELLAVGWRQVDRVLVGHVEAGNRDDAMVLHLLDELPGQLDGLDVRSEGTPEDAFEQGLDLVFDVSEHAHCRGLVPRITESSFRLWPPDRGKWRGLWRRSPRRAGLGSGRGFRLAAGVRTAGSGAARGEAPPPLRRARAPRATTQAARSARARPCRPPSAGRVCGRARAAEPS